MRHYTADQQHMDEDDEKVLQRLADVAMDHGVELKEVVLEDH